MTAQSVPPPSYPVLVVDDELNMRRILQAMLEKEGYRVLVAANGVEALEQLRKTKVSVVITDIRMPKMDGMQVLEAVKEQHSDTAVIVITAFGTIEVAVDALKLGAIDFITKPYDQDQLRQTVAKAYRVFQANLQEGLHPGHFQGKWQGIGQSKAMQEVYRLVLRTADSPSTVLITGESGTGKELIAKAIHQNSSRKAQPFIAINCAAIPETLIESEFFGHEKGSFTGAVASRPGRFELADKGTLFLDEIGEISKEMQVKLLRVLQEKTIERVGGRRTLSVDFRLVTATNRDLTEEVRVGNFRQDLYFRLNVVHIHLPPLRERIDDLPLLTNHFIGVFSQRLGREVKGIEPSALRKLMRYHWPGNIRELENILERAVLLANGALIAEADLQLPASVGTPQPVELPETLDEPDDVDADLDEELASGDIRPLKELVREYTERIERQAIVQALQKHGGNVTRAARELQISRKSLQLKMKEYDLREE